MSHIRPLPHSAVKIQKFKSQDGEATFCNKNKATAEKQFKCCSLKPLSRLWTLTPNFFFFFLSISVASMPSKPLLDCTFPCFFLTSFALFFFPQGPAPLWHTALLAVAYSNLQNMKKIARPAKKSLQMFNVLISAVESPYFPQKSL